MMLNRYSFLSLLCLSLAVVGGSTVWADDATSKADKKIQQALSDEDQKEVQLAGRLSSKQAVINEDCLSKFALPAYDNESADTVNDFDHIGNGWSADASQWIKSHPATARKLYEDTEKTLESAHDKKCQVIAYGNKKNFSNAAAYLSYMKRLCNAGKKGSDYPYFCPKSIGTNEILDDLKNGALRFL